MIRGLHVNIVTVIGYSIKFHYHNVNGYRILEQRKIFVFRYESASIVQINL